MLNNYINKSKYLEDNSSNISEHIYCTSGNVKIYQMQHCVRIHTEHNMYNFQFINYLPEKTIKK
jgi:hypothetical protein